MDWFDEINKQYGKEKQENKKSTWASAIENRYVKDKTYSVAKYQQERFETLTKDPFSMETVREATGIRPMSIGKPKEKNVLEYSREKNAINKILQGANEIRDIRSDQTLMSRESAGELVSRYQDISPDTLEKRGREIAMSILTGKGTPIATGVEEAKRDFLSTGLRFLSQETLSETTPKERVVNLPFTNKTINIPTATSIRKNLTKNILGDKVGKFIDWANNKANEIDKKTAEKYPQAKNTWERVQRDLGSGAFSIGTALATTYATGNPYSAGVLFGIQAKTKGTQQALEAGKTLEEAQRIGYAKGAVEGILEYYGLDNFIKISGTTATRIAKGALTEFIQEASQELGGRSIDYISGLDQPTVDKILADIGDGLYAGMLGAVLGGSAGAINISQETEQVSSNLQQLGFEEKEADDKAKELMEKVIDEVNIEAEKIIEAGKEETEPIKKQTAEEFKQQTKQVEAEDGIINRQTSEEFKQGIEEQGVIKKQTVDEFMGREVKGDAEETKLDQALIEEAKKYKSAEEFVNNKISDKAWKDFLSENESYWKDGKYIDKQSPEAKQLESDASPQSIRKAQFDWQHLGTEEARKNLLDSFKTDEGKKYLSKIIKILPKNSDGTISVFRAGKLLYNGPQSFTLSSGRAEYFSKYGTDVQPAILLDKNAKKTLEINSGIVEPKYIVGYSPFDAEVLIESKNVKTAQELTEIYNKAQAEKEVKKNVKVKKETIKTEAPKEVKIKKVVREQLPVKPLEIEGKKKASKLESRIKKTLDNISEEKIEELGLATYNEMNKKEQIKKATEFVVKNEEDAIDILLGKKQTPKGLLRNSIFIALQNKATQDINKELALKLATLESTRLGQEISILTEVDEYSPVNAINQLVKIYEKAYQKRTGKSYKEAKKSEIKKMKDRMRSTKGEWNSFIDSIVC